MGIPQRRTVAGEVLERSKDTMMMHRIDKGRRECSDLFWVFAERSSQTVNHVVFRIDRKIDHRCKIKIDPYTLKLFGHLLIGRFNLRSAHFADLCRFGILAVKSVPAFQALHPSALLIHGDQELSVSRTGLKLFCQFGQL